MSSSERLFCRSAAWRWVTRRLVLRWALQGTQPCGDVLEIGGGSGAMAEGTVRVFPDGRLTVTDVDPAMLAAAQRRLTTYGCRVVGADSTRLPFRDQTYDMVVSYLMLHHVIDWERALAEAGRVLRSGGLLVGYDLLETPLTEWPHRADRSPHRLIQRSQLQPALQAAGLEVVTVRSALRQQIARFIARRPARPPAAPATAPAAAPPPEPVVR